MPETYVCRECGVSFLAKPSEKRAYCSTECYHMLKMSAEARFWAKVDKQGPVPPERPHMGPCWIWLGTVSVYGYGAFGIDGKQHKAHRLAYEWTVGPITTDTLDHRCRVKTCVNPAHLAPESFGANTLLGEAPPALNARKTHCKYGHPFDEVNTRRAYGKRQCRTCIQARRERYRTRGTHLIALARVRSGRLKSSRHTDGPCKACVAAEERREPAKAAQA